MYVPYSIHVCTILYTCTYYIHCLLYIHLEILYNQLLNTKIILEYQKLSGELFQPSTVLYIQFIHVLLRILQYLNWQYIAHSIKTEN